MCHESLLDKIRYAVVNYNPSKHVECSASLIKSGNCDS